MGRKPASGLASRNGTKTPGLKMRLLEGRGHHVGVMQEPVNDDGPGGGQVSAAARQAGTLAARPGEARGEIALNRCHAICYATR